MSKYNLRGDNPNQKYDDDTLLLNNQNKTFSCKGCELVFRNEKAYLLHQAGCITVKVDMSKQGSFFNAQLFSKDSPKPGGNDGEKVLPMSQPLGEYNHRDRDEDAVINNYGTSDEMGNELNLANNDPAANVLVANNNIAPEETEDPNCPVCREEVENGQPGINCDRCKTWFHRSCLHMTEAMFEELENSEEEWFCMHCLSIKANKIKWGDMEGEETIQEALNNTYKIVTQWKKNFFFLPRGKSGSDYLKEKTRLLYLLINNTPWARLSLGLVHILGPLMLQKPSSNSRARDNANYLQRRLQLWSEGKLQELINEGLEIQKKTDSKTQKKIRIQRKELL